MARSRLVALAAAPVRHRPEIRRGAGAVGRTYRLVCTCGQTGPEQAARRMAQVDLNEHVSSLPRVPAAQQCQHPTAHDRRHWEPCQTCADQLALFDLAEVTG